jgi:cytochrome c peroxidase
MFLTSSPLRPFTFPDPADLGINNQGRFKSGSLRNITATAPYFHNGAVADITALLSSGIPAHQVPAADRPKFIAFMQTLQDNTITTEPKFANPFK